MELRRRRGDERSSAGSTRRRGRRSCAVPESPSALPEASPGGAAAAAPSRRRRTLCGSPTAARSAVARGRSPGAGGGVRIGIACEGEAPPAELLALLEARACRAVAALARRPPALLRAGDAVWLLARASDVLRACDRGGLDVGVVGKDRLLEGRRGAAHLSTCAAAATTSSSRSRRRRAPRRRLRVATRHPEAARRHFSAAGMQPDIIAMDERRWRPGWPRGRGRRAELASCPGRRRARPGVQRSSRGAAPASSPRGRARPAARRIGRSSSACAPSWRIHEDTALETTSTPPWRRCATLAPRRPRCGRPSRAIVADVRARGDEAVREHTARLDRVELPARLRRPAAEMRQRSTAPAAGAARRARDWPPPTSAPTTSARRRAWRETLPQGQVVGQEVVPLAAAGLYVPGGLADYPSSVLMTVIPAQVAGVERIVVCSPPRPRRRRRRRRRRRVRAAGHRAPVPGRRRPGGGGDGLRHRERAALRRDRRAGQRLGHRGQAAGHGRGRHRRPRRAQRGARSSPTTAAEPAWLAADLLAQAEHGAGRHGVPRSTSAARWSAPVAAAVERLAAELGIATDNVAVVACPDRAAALALVNAFAPEHLELHLRGRRATWCPGAQRRRGLRRRATPRPPSPTTPPAPTTCCPPAARRASARACRVVDFQKRVGVVELDGAAARALAPPVAAIADEEGLRAHALSARLRAE